jgi:hypothetical protein
MPLDQRFSNCGAPPPPRGWGGGAVGPLGGGGGQKSFCMKDIFILNKIWAQHFGSHIAWLKYFTYHFSTSTGSEL